MTSPNVHSAAQGGNVKGQPSSAGEEEGEMETINPEVWYACGGPMAELPPAESMVVYFPQGHYQQVAGLVPHMPNYLNLPSKLICLLHSANLHADRVTDEVYAQMTLHPRKHDEEALLLSENVMRQIRPQADSCYSQTDFYCWTLSTIDVITSDGISIPYHVAEELFPPLDFSMHIPSQYLRFMDLHGNLWIFRHVYRGQPKGHFLTIGWSKFVSAKNLFAGDSVLFIRDATQMLVLGIRRARAASRYSPVLSNCSMDTGILAEAVHAAANRSPFTILYYPRAAPSSFVIPFEKYQKAVYSYQIFLGMRLSMRFETERTWSKIYFGTLTGISDLDPLQWKNSEWKQLQVLWDESTSCERQNRVSIWEIEPLLDPELPIMQDNKVSEMENISVKATSSTEPQSKMENILVKATPSTKPQSKVYKTLNGPARDILDKNGVVEDLRQLDRMLTRMRAMLNDAEQREIDEEAVKLWLRELKCVAGDAEDILDEYRYELLRCQIEIQKASTVLSSCGKRKLPDDYSASSSSFQHGKVTIPDGLSDKIKEIRSRFDEISGDREALRLTVEDGEKKVGGTGSVNYPLPTSHLVDKSSIFGRRDDKKKIMELVLSGEQDLFRVIPIVGMGGIGKTTVAQMVYDDPMVHATFDVRAWIYVSPEFDVIRISKEISEFVTGKPGGGFDGFSKVQEEIQKSLVGKKLLLVLDDMWIEQKNCWEMLLFPLRAAKMVRVLVTTRNESVAKIVQTVTPQHLGLLPYNECWQLFMHCVFGYTEMRYSRLSLIGKQIIEKCGGLPLALKCIGGLLRFKKDEDSWMEIMESELWESYECDKVFCALKVSYSHLDPNLKRCFLFCSLFPKGSLLKRIEIIYMWMAHGYIQPREGQRAEDLAEKYLSELCMRSFILFHKKNSFILHDVIYDLGRSLSAKEIHTIMDDKPCHISDEIRHVYVKNGNNPCYSFNRACRVRTFLNATTCDIGCLRVLGLMGSNVHMLASSGCRLKNLRYLGIRQIDLKELPESICLFYHLEALTMSSCYKLIKLPINIGNLVNLRYFHLSHAGIEELPDTFCKLYSLQTLHLEECNNLRELPKDIGILSSLRMLRLKSCKCIKRLPSGIKKLNNLMILDVRGCSNLHGIFESIGDLLLRFHLGKLHIMHEDLVKTADSRLHGDHRGFKLYEGSKRMLAHGRNTSISSHDQSDCSYSSPFSMTQIDVSDGRNTWMSPYDQSDYDIMSFSEMFLYDGVDRLEFSPNKKN